MNKEHFWDQALTTKKCEYSDLANGQRTARLQQTRSSSEIIAFVIQFGVPTIEDREERVTACLLPNLS